MTCSDLLICIAVSIALHTANTCSDCCFTDRLSCDSLSARGLRHTQVYIANVFMLPPWSLPIAPHCLSWLSAEIHENPAELCSPPLLLLLPAAQVCCLHHMGVPCSTDAVDGAAAGGHLQARDGLPCQQH